MDSAGKKRKVADIEAEIFGDSDESDNALREDYFEFSSSESEDDAYEQPAEQFESKKASPTTLKESEERDGIFVRSNKKKVKSKKKVRPTTDQFADFESPEDEKIKEARQDFDKALKSLKPKRKKKMDSDDVAVDDMIVKMKQEMKDAAEKDKELNKQKQPAIAKVLLLPSVTEQFRKTVLFDYLLENNILEAIRLWLEPMDDGSLPTLDIQKAMFSVIEKYTKLHAVSLRESGLGRVILFYSKCDEVIIDLQRKAKSLINLWSRPILQRSADYRDRVVKEINYVTDNSGIPTKKQSNQNLLSKKYTVYHIPQFVKFLYDF